MIVKDQPLHDSKYVQPSVERIDKTFGQIASFTGDRGFHSQDNSTFLKKENIVNGICPKSVKELESNRENDHFVRFQKRRAQTGGRIGILKNCILENPLNCKEFKNREPFVSLSVLVHNLWLLGRMARDAHYEKLKQAA